MSRACTSPPQSSRNSSHDLSRIALFLTLTALWIFISWPVFQGRLGWHDLEFTPQRFISLADGMSTAFPVYLYPGFSFDYGYPTGVFYPDKFLYPFALLVHHEWLTYIQAVQLYVLCRNAAVILISFYSFHHIFQSRWVALFGCVLYSSSMWHLSNLYVRLALGEFTAMVFLPLLAAGIYDLRRSRTWSSIFLLAIGYTGLISSHVITTLLATYCLALYALIEWRVLLVKNFGLTTRAAFVTLLCNIGFIAPFLSWVGIICGQSAGSVANFTTPSTFQNWGLYFWMLPSLRYSLGLHWTSPPFPIGVGVALLSALGAGTALLLYMHIAKKRSVSSNNKNTVQQNNKLHHLAVTLLLTILTLILTTRYFPWHALGEYVPVLWSALGKNIQFPWRWQTFSTLFLTLLAMQSLAYLKSETEKTRRDIRRADRSLSAALYTAIIIFLSLWQGGVFMSRIVHELPPARYWDNNIERPMLDDRIYALKGTIHPNRHSPKDRNIILSSKSLSATGYKRAGFYFGVRIQNSGKTLGWMDFPVWNYPGYKAVSGKGEKLDIADGDNRRVRVYLPPGFNDTFTLRWVAPWYWRLAHIVSWVSLAALLLFTLTPLQEWLARIVPRRCGLTVRPLSP